MANKELKTRDQIPQEYKWKIEAMYPDEALWDEDVKTALAMSQDFTKLSGHLTDSPQDLAKAFALRDKIYQKVEKAYVYAKMRQDEDNRVAKYQEMIGKISAALAHISANTSFFVPEILNEDAETLRSYVKAEAGLKSYSFAIESLILEAKHVLSKEEENILAQMSETSGASNEIFTMLNNAEMDFGTIIDEDGDQVKLTHGNYINFMESKDRRVRKDAFEAMYKAYKKLINTIGTTYAYSVKTEVVSARIRKYKSARNAALASDNIPDEVYDNLVSVVNEYLPVLHRYINLRKKLLKLDELKMYDVYTPLFENPVKEISFDEGIEMVKKALEPMGEEYVNRLSEGVKAGWIDIYENEGKTSGAYSFGSYDSMPYVLLNYTDTLQDVFTIIHELGHSMHSSYTRENQPYIYGDHSIFTAEVASTVNESLLMRYLLDKETNKEARKYLLNHYLEEFRTTLFRQTMFAEFEDLTHKEIENGGALTAQWMNEKYYELNKKYFGEAMADDEYIQYEWARIPHFYRGFYVYQYATGFSAATAISKKILSEGEPAVQAYKEFLKTGSSNYPVELLKIAGVDMGKPEPIRQAMETFKTYLEELEDLI
ncbi:MAG: oligoendopeptidase F [Clostridia bacterium]|nr:oligoendopeptidase F [Clostridia bacterium]